MMKKRWISLLLAVCMVLQLCGSMAFATELESDPVFPISGKCGMNLTWTLNENGTLTISGSGAMFSDYNFYDEDLYKETPWFEYVGGIEKIVVEEGVTSIAPFAFFNCYMAQSVEIPSTVTSIGAYAFSYCGGESSCRMIFDGAAPNFDENAFADCRAFLIYSPTAEGWAEIAEPSDNPNIGADFAGGYVFWLPLQADGTILSGYCGEDSDDEGYEPDENLAWTLNIDGTLIVTGSGAMTGFPDWRDMYRKWITDVRLPEGLTVIGGEAFYGCTNLRQVTIPDTVTEIGFSAFCECYLLTDITMGSAVEIIGENAFDGTAITAITLPDTLTEIGYGAFSSCTDLETVTFLGDAPTFVYEQYDEIFYDVTATCYYPADNTTWTEDVRQNYGGTLAWVPYEGEEEPEQPAIINWSLQDGVLTISGSGEIPCYDDPAEGTDNVAPWYSSRDDIEKIVIQEGITSIGSYAFPRLDKVRMIEIAESVQLVDSYAFYYQSGEVATIMLFKGDAPSISDLAFDTRYNTYGVYLEGKEGWAQLGSYHANLNWFAMDENGIIESGTCDENAAWTIHIDGTLTITGSGSLVWGIWPRAPYSHVVIEEGITSVDNYAFSMTSMTSVTIPASVTTIGDRAFDENLKLTEITFKGDAPTFGDSPFAYAGYNAGGVTAYYPANNTTWSDEVMQDYGAADLTWVAVEMAQPEAPETDSKCGDNLTWSLDENGVLTISGTGDMCNYHWLNNPAPWDMDAIKEVVIEEGVTSIGENAFFQSSTLQKVTLSSAVTTISAGAFYSCTALNEVSLNEGLQVIEGEAFCASALTAVTLPSTVTEIGYMAFAYGSLSEITVLAPTEPTLAERVFDGLTLTTYANWASWSSTQWGTVLPIPGMEEPDTTAPVIHEFWPTTEEDVTFCHDGTLQVAASDETVLDRAEAYANGVLIGSAGFDGSGLAAIKWNCADLSGTVTLTYVVYDKAGNCAEATADVTIRPYTAPATPINLTVENGFRSATIKWEYTGDLATLKQFNIYDGDPDGGMLVTTVKDYKYTFRDLSEEATFVVAAVDIYGQQSFNSEIITVTPILTENEKPVARLQAGELTAVTGTAITLTGAGSTDNDKIASYTWDFGDGTTAEGVHATHTYTEAREYTVILTVTDRSGNTGTATCTVTVYDTLGADATHAMLTVTVMDGYTAGTPAIENATVTVYSDGFEAVSLTDNAGQATLVVPRGTHTMTVVKDGFDGRMGEIEVTPDESGSAAKTIYLAESGVSIVDGDLTVTPMTREEMEEVGIDPDDPANNHVVKQQTTIRFQPMPELAFDIPVEQIFDALGNLIPDKSSGFGWHTFTPDPDPDDPEDDEEEDDDDDNIQNGFVTDPTRPKYDVGVFPVGDSAYMVIYGQSHWLKEMFNVELIVYNNSYAQDITDCVAELNLPEGLSLAAMLEGEQTEQVYIGQIDYIGKTDGSGTAIGLPTRQVNWYVRGDAEGDYNLTAAVDGFVGGDRFHTDFTTSDPIHVYAGSALLLTVTMPKSAYAEKEYAVKFSLNNVSDKPIYNLTFGIDTAQQFVAERMSDGSTGEVEREYSNEDFEGGMTYGLPTLEPGKAFNLVLKTTFAYEHQFVEWAVGRIPLDVAEVGYQVADCFVTTLEGSTTEIPVEIILEDVKKDNIFQWIWDSTIGALKENTKETIIELVDDKVFQGVPVVETGVEIVEVITNIMGELEETEIEYIPTVNVTDGVQCVPKNEVDDWLSAFDTYTLRRSALPGIIVWTDAEDAGISEDGRSMTMPSGGKLYMLRLGETAVTPEIAVTTYYVDGLGEVQSFTQTLTAAEGLDENGAAIGGTYIPGLKAAKYIRMEPLSETTFATPEEGELVTARFEGFMISAEGDILMNASNAVWTVLDENGVEAEDVWVAGGVLTIGSMAKGGTYTVRLELEGEDVDAPFEQDITLTGGDNTGSGDDNTGSGGDNTGSGDDNTGSGDDNTGSGDDNTGSGDDNTGSGDDNTGSGDDNTGSGDDNAGSGDDNTDSGSGSSSGSSGTGISKPGTSNKPSGKDEQNEQKRDLPFGDIDTDDWFAESVGYVYEKGLMKGTSEKTFSPYVDTSRAMIVTILWRLAGSPVVNYLMPFEDVPQELWYSEAVRWAAAEGIVGGYSATEFRPEGNITREQFAAILWRYAKFMGYDVSVGEDTNILSYNDAFDISEYAISALQWTCGAGILRGKTESTLNPMDGAIRAEAATILMRFCENIID